MKLGISEKPSVARTIAGLFGSSEKKEGYIQGNGYIVTWCIGHLVTLAKPEMYDANYDKWQYSDLPILPSSWKLQVKEKTKKQYNSTST